MLSRDASCIWSDCSELPHSGHYNGVAEAGYSRLVSADLQAFDKDGTAWRRLRSPGIEEVLFAARSAFPRTNVVKTGSVRARIFPAQARLLQKWILLRMCSPTSDIFEIRAIPNAGRGVIAIRDIPAGTLVLESGPPATHIIFKEYRKETCAFCFRWDRGRTLPVREHELGKYFCSSECQRQWKEEQGDVGIESWRIVTAFGSRNVRRRPSDDEVMSDAVRPTKEEIASSWAVAAQQAKLLLRGRSAASFSKQERKQLQALRQDLAQSMDTDMLGYLLEGALFCHQHPLKWRQEVLSLAMDDTPYKTQQDLDSNCKAFLQLTSILPESILSTFTAELCLALVQADNHNAFGIRGGGEDSEEYMGYGVYPSASYFNHSCDPSIGKHRRGRSWQFHALRDISVGEECCITYLGGDEKDMDVLERVRRLRDVWDFVCVCQRCKTEAGI